VMNDFDFYFIMVATASAVSTTIGYVMGVI
jgi:hypothetical protein